MLQDASINQSESTSSYILEYTVSDYFFFYGLTEGGGGYQLKSW